jgi:single-strand DNA-binding protein
VPNVNIVVLAGHATRDPEVRALGGGDTTLIKFGLAVNNRKKNSATGQWEDDPVFVDVAYFTKNSNYVGNGLHKGGGVMVKGRLQLEQWQDKATGANRSKLSVVAEDVHLLGGKVERQTAARQPEQPANEPNDESIPF